MILKIVDTVMETAIRRSVDLAILVGLLPHFSTVKSETLNTATFSEVQYRAKTGDENHE